MKVAVETMSLSEASQLFREVVKEMFPKSKLLYEKKIKALKKAKVTRHKWVDSFEVAGGKLRFYYEQIPKDVKVNAGFVFRRKEGLVLITPDVNNGGVAPTALALSEAMRGPKKWEWMMIYSGHFCIRYAERILKGPNPTFEAGSEALMLSDFGGAVKVVDKISDGVEEIEFLFKEGLCLGYRDRNNKIVYLKTVISHDMQKGDQVKYLEEFKETVDALYDLFKANQ